MPRVKCPHCKSPAVLRSVRPVSEITSEFYVQCKDIECGHTFVSHMTVSHTVRPSGKANPAVRLPFSPHVRPLRAIPEPTPANDAASGRGAFEA